jgi:hypothetical protein
MNLLSNREKNYEGEVNMAFYGDWLVKVDQINADFSQQFTIIGSDSSDGTYPGIPGTAVTVSGEGWGIIAKWNDGTSGWTASLVREVVAYTVQGGLNKTWNIDDGVGDGDYNDMILVCQSLDPTINPMLPFNNPYNFTITESMLDPTALDPTEEPEIKKNIFLPFVSK